MVDKIKDWFWKEYALLDKNYNAHKDPKYEYLVNFSQTKNQPISRWFYYVEGYSPQLVINILDHLNLNNRNTTIFDPFSGSGTTLLTAKQLGMSSIGMEINPFSAFMIRAKTQNYSASDIDEIGNFELPKYKEMKDVFEKYELKIIKNLFDKEKLEKIELIKNKINAVENNKVKSALKAALLSILEPVSNYKKGGNGLKKKRVNKNLDPFEEFSKKLKQMVEDLRTSVNGPEPIIINDSCMNFEEHQIEPFDISIFSPPYANCFDPFEVYKIELWIGEFVKSYDELRGKRKQALTSNLNANVKKEIHDEHRTEVISEIIKYLESSELWDKRIPKMIDTYFHEMYLLLKMLYAKTKKGGYCIIIVGNSAYGNLSIPTDSILAQMGEKAGFKVEEIIIARKNETSSQQYAKIGKFIDYIRESLVVLRK
jgi:hypothetical protein